MIAEENEASDYKDYKGRKEDDMMEGKPIQRL